MTTREIEKMAIELMTQHGLIQKGWKFEWNKRKNNFGLCNEKKKAISLSLMTIPFVNVEKIKDTVLHEIAHALVGVSNQHNNVWRNCAIKIGSKGERCDSIVNNIISEEHKEKRDIIVKKNAIIYECKVCKNELIRKIPLKQDTSCSKCYPKFDRRFLFVLKEDNRINKMPTKPIIYSRILSRV